MHLKLLRMRHKREILRHPKISIDRGTDDELKDDGKDPGATYTALEDLPLLTIVSRPRHKSMISCVV